MLKRPVRSEEGKDMAHKSTQRNHRCGSRQLADNRRAGSTTARLPCTKHLDSIGLIKAAFRRQLERQQDAHPFACLFDLLIVFSDPGPHDFAEMEGGHYRRPATRSASFAPPTSRSTTREIE